MDYFRGIKIQISPCIAAKVKYALNLTSKKPANNKICGIDYWGKVIDTFSLKNNLTSKNTEEAKNKFKS